MSVDSLFREFLTGRRSFAALVEDLTSLTAGSPSGLAALDDVMTDLVNAGRLPNDLAQILRASLGAAGPRQAGGTDWLDPPTEIRAIGPVPTLGPRPGPRGGQPMPVVPGPGEAPLPPAGSLHTQVDEALLSTLTGDFKAYRQRGRRKAVPDDAVQNRLLDSALESFRGVRLRRDATKAAEGTGRSFELPAETTTGEERSVGVGTILKGRFVLDREIGRGGMGIVYRAVDRRRLEASHQQPYVALKLLSADMRRSPETLRALEAEARRAQELSHPNIVTVFDFDRDAAHIFVVMELLQGRPLDAVLGEAGPSGLGFEASRRLVDEICRGLAYAHERGVIHCDLKPANVFVTDPGGIKILDFGLAIAKRGGSYEAAALDGYTPAYASPDILEGKPRHPSDDVYALGCLVYVMLTGRHPFGRSSAVEAREQRLEAARPDAIPGPAWRSLRRALSFDRDHRQADAELFRAAYFQTGFRTWFRR